LTQAGLQAESLDDCLLQGGYPALYDRHLSADDWFASYVSTYLERDVRQLIAVRDLSLFQRFVRMCAARSGQLLNLSALAADCGVTAVTAKQWLSVLQTSYLVTTIAPYHRNFGKRLVKSPKLYFLDVGLMAWLLGIRDAQTLGVHSLRGELFETWVVSEMLKAQLNQGRHSDLFFWRDNVGTEVDAVYERNVGGQTKLVPVEIKSGSTFASDWLRPVQKWQTFANQTDPETTAKPVLIYGGEGDFERQNCRLIGWREFAADGVPS
jgi:predicted AAA+ superfamily ATPase